MTGISDDELKGAFREAFPETDHSVLASMERQGKSVPRVLLRDLDEESQLLKPRGGREGRYQVVGEIARGGVGVVLKGRDIDLGRDVAMKVLRDEHADNDEVVQRFVEEAQIGGQLQHPGIIPIYEMGLNEKQRPYFTMKLVKGETLAARLRDRKDPRQGQRRLLAIFERVCDAMAYAHSRGVVHRDLKPANIITGAYAEVQVVDWGFAKVLGHEDTVSARSPELTIVSTVRSEGGSESMVGSVLGTPAYMPPEQALGQVESLDQRSDVFALGAILCEILTGQPPYVGDTIGELLVQARRCDLAEVKQRLGLQTLAPLVLECLDAGQSRRPADAGVVAERIRQHLASIEDRARAARVTAAKTEARTHEERRARRMVLAIAATVLVALSAGGATWIWKENRDRESAQQTRTKVEALLDEAKIARGQQERVLALGAAREALAVAETGAAAPALRDQAADLLVELQDEEREFAAESIARAEEAAFERTWEEALARGGDEWDAEAFDRSMLQAIESLGSLEERPLAFRQTVAACLEVLAAVRQLATSHLPFKPLLERAKHLDTDAFRTRVRDLLIAEDKEALEQLAEGAELDERLNLLSLAIVLRHYRSPSDLQVRLRLQFVRQYPRSIVGPVQLGHALVWAGRKEEATRYYTAALALQPTSAQCRHNLLLLEPDVEKRIALMRRALIHRPDYGHGWCHVGGDLLLLGKPEEAMRAARKGVALEPTVENYLRLAEITLSQQGHAEAVSLLEEAIEVQRDTDDASDPARRKSIYLEIRLVELLNYTGRSADALALAEELTRIRPDLSTSWLCLARQLGRDGDTEAASEACRETLRNDHWISSVGYTSILKLLPVEEATEVFRRRTARWPENKAAWHHLGLALVKSSKREEAAKALLHVLELDPDNEAVYRQLSDNRLLPNETLIERAVRALRASKGSAKRHYILAYLQGAAGDRAEATRLYDKAIGLDRFVSATAYQYAAKGRTDAKQAIATLQAGLHAFPGSHALRLALVQRLVAIGDKAGAVKACRRALRHRRAIPEALPLWYALSAIRPDEALALLEEALGSAPRAAPLWFLKGGFLRHRAPDEARDAYRKAIALAPRVGVFAYVALSQLVESAKEKEETLRAGLRALAHQAPARIELGLLLAEHLVKFGDKAGAADAYRRVLDDDGTNQAAWIGWIQYGRPEDVEAQLKKSLEAKSESAALWYVHAWLMAHLKKNDEAVRSYRKAIEIDPRVNGWAYVNLANRVDTADKARVLRAGLRAFAHRAPEEIAAQAPERIRLGLRLAEHLVKIGDKAGGVDAYRRVLEDDGTNLTAWYQWLTHERIEDIGVVKAQLTKSLDAKPESGALWYIHAQLMQRLKKNDEAVRSYRKAIDFKPRVVVWAYWNLSSLVDTAAEKEATLRAGLRAFADQVWQRTKLGLRLAEHLAEIGDKAGAADAYRRVLDDYGTNLTAWIGWLKYGPLEVVEAQLTKSLEAKRESAALWYVHARLMERLEKKDQAVRSYRKAIERNPDLRPDMYGHLARLLEDDEAMATLRQGIERFPKPDDARQQMYLRADLASRLYTAGRTKEAVASLEDAPLRRWVDPRDLVEQGLPRKLALQVLERAMADFPAAAYLPYHLALELKSEEKDAAAAIAALQQALAIQGDGRMGLYWRWACAMYLYGLGAEKASRRAFETLPESGRRGDSPDHLTLARFFANCPFEALRDAKRAVEHAKRAVDKMPSAWAISMLGLALYRAGDYEMAIARLEPQLERLTDSKKKRATCWLAMAHWNAGRHEKARSTLAAAKAIELESPGKSNIGHKIVERVVAEAEALIR